MNILNNAQQAIPNQGKLTITTRRDNDLVTIRIRDTGVGIPEEIKNKIFDPFFTTKEPGVGTGLGLSLSFGIVTKIGGTIVCHTKLGQGTEFVVTLPGRSSPPPEVETDMSCSEGLSFSWEGTNHEAGHLIR